MLYGCVLVHPALCAESGGVSIILGLDLFFLRFRRHRGPQQSRASAASDGCESQDLGADTESREAGLDAEQAVGLLDGVDDRFDIQWLDGAEVDDFALNAVLLLDVLGGSHGLSDATGEGHDREILSGALDFGFSEGNDEVVFLGGFAHGEGLAVKELVLKHADWVGVADGRL
mgnify:CR=1 FL=1